MKKRGGVVLWISVVGVAGALGCEPAAGPAKPPLGVARQAGVAWGGFADRSDELGTDGFSFQGDNAAAGDSNENYYDGTFADFDGDGQLDRALISRYGLLHNQGGGAMTPAANVPVNVTGYRFGDKDGVGNDGVRFADVDGDGDPDSLQGGNGEAFVLQTNRRGRFSTAWQKSGSATDITPIDLEGDGDVDLVASSAFCFTRDCGQPTDFKLWVNDGDGNFTDETGVRGLGAYANERITEAAAGDMDGDGDFDLVLVDGGRDAVSDDCGAGGRAKILLLRNNGSGSFAEQSVYDVPCVDPDSWGVGLGGGGLGQNAALGDVDGDGDLDFVVAGLSRLGGHAQVYHALLINDGTGDMTEESEDRFNVGGFAGNLYSSTIKLADLDLDGDLDLAGFVQEGEGFDAIGDNLFQVMLNDGSGRFDFVPDAWERYPTPITGGLSTMDIADYTGDGAVDVWLGQQGERVRTLVNEYVSPDGLPADVPRDFTLVSESAAGVTVSWAPPVFASTVRFYRVYRSTMPGQLLRDRELLHTVGMTPHANEVLVAPIGPETTTSDLGDPAVSIDAGGTITFTDSTAEPGVDYWYSVVHVGPETKASQPSSEVEAARDAEGGADVTPPVLRVLSPTSDDFSQYARVVLDFGDGGSGVDLSSLVVSFDQPLGDRPAGSNVADLFLYADERGAVAAFAPPYALPFNSVVTVQASISDLDGNPATAQAQFFVGVQDTALPTASSAADPDAGGAPLTVAFSGAASADDVLVMQWEWYFGDGTSALGRDVTHTYTTPGTYTALLVARDNDGGVATAPQTIEVGPSEGTGGAGAGGDASGSGSGGDASAAGSGGNPGDAGSGAGNSSESNGANGSGAEDASATNGTGASSGDGSASDGGCDCHASPGRTSAPAAWATALCVAWAVRRRRAACAA
jgi:PKD repeat protein